MISAVTGRLSRNLCAVLCCLLALAVIYAPEGHSDYRPLIGTILLLGAVIAVLAALTITFRRLNLRLAAEIDERKVVEEELRVSEQKYAAIFNVMPDMVGITRQEDGHLAEVNRGFELCTGWTREEAIGRSTLELGLWDAAARSRCLQLLNEKGYLENHEFIMTVKSGARRHAMMFIIPITLEGGAYLCFLVRDITERKEAESAILKSEEKYRRLYESMGDAFVRVSMSGFITEYNNTYRTMLGYSDDELHVLNYRDITPEDWHALEADIVASQILVRGYSDVYEKEYRRKDGTVFPVELRSFLIRNDDGQPEGMWAIVRDVTERQHAESALRESEWMLRESQQVAQLGSYVFDTVAGTWKSSEILDTIFGIDREYVRDLSGWLAIVHPDDVETMKTYVVDEVFSRHLPFDREYRIVRRNDGEARWVSGLGQLQQDEAGNVIRMLGTIQDITDKKSVQIELADAKEAADAANRAKSEFLANMSHEIRTPMNGIIGMAQLLEFTELTDVQKHYLHAIKLSSENLLSLISDILDLSKIEAGKVELERIQFSLRGTISDVVKTQVAHIDDKGLSIRIAIPEHVPDSLTGDQFRLKQILLNLLSNAIKFTPKGEIVISVDTEERLRDQALIRFSVADTGVGIETDAIMKIFAPFSQADASTTRRYGGTGLGLSICRKIADLMGGNIRVESSKGVGSTFHVAIPFTVNEVEMAPRERLEKCHAPVWDTTPLRILVAEDNDINQRVFVALLQQAGHTPTIARNGEEVLVQWDKGGIDMILMDVQMPGLDGGEATRTIRERERQNGGHTPIIALTAYAMREDREKFLAMGFDGYVSKPFQLQQLKDEMERCMRALAEP